MSLMQKLGYMSTISVQVTTSNILIFIRILQLSEGLNEPLSFQVGPVLHAPETIDIKIFWGSRFYFGILMFS